MGAVRPCGLGRSGKPLDGLQEPPARLGRRAAGLLSDSPSRQDVGPSGGLFAHFAGIVRPPDGEGVFIRTRPLRRRRFSRFFRRAGRSRLGANRVRRRATLCASRGIIVYRSIVYRSIVLGMGYRSHPYPIRMGYDRRFYDPDFPLFCRGCLPNVPDFKSTHRVRVTGGGGPAVSVPIRQLQDGLAVWGGPAHR